MNDETAKYVRIMFIISGNPHVHIVMIFIALHFSSGVVGRERMGTAFPHKKLSGNGVPTREILRDIFLLLPLN